MTIVLALTIQPLTITNAENYRREYTTVNMTDEIVARRLATLEEMDRKRNDEEIQLISQLVMAEAEGEPLEGKRYVIDVIFNRVDSDEFPDTIEEVIFQTNQFECLDNGRFDRCEPNPELYDLILFEREYRTDKQVLYFTANGYGQYGTPHLYISNHYFSI